MSIDYLTERLKIDEHNLDQEIAEQPVLLMAAHDLFADASRDLANKKQELSEREAEEYQIARVRLEEAGEKVTEARIGHIVVEKTRAEKLELIKAQHAVHRADGLVRAYQQRGMLLRDLAQLAVTRYYSTDAVKVDPVARMVVAREQTDNESNS